MTQQGGQCLSTQRHNTTNEINRNRKGCIPLTELRASQPCEGIHATSLWLAHSYALPPPGFTLKSPSWPLQPARVFIYRMSRKMDRNGKMSKPNSGGEKRREEDRVQVKYLRHKISLCTFLKQGIGAQPGGHAKTRNVYVKPQIHWNVLK